MPLASEPITQIEPLAKDPMMRRVRVGEKTVATLRAAEVESLGLVVGKNWTDSLARKVDEVLTLHKVRKTAFSILARRPYSSAELIQRLVKKNFERKLAERIVAELIADRWIDDENFARQVADEARRRGPAGASLVRAKLESHQVTADIAERIVSNAVRGIDPVEAALSLVRRRLGTMTKLPANKQRLRIGSLLGRRGFDDDVINDVLARMNLAIEIEDDA